MNNIIWRDKKFIVIAHNKKDIDNRGSESKQKAAAEVTRLRFT